MFSSITDGSLVRTGKLRPLAGMVKIAPVWPVQYGVVPAPSVEGPVAQLDVPTGPPVPASVTTRPALVSTRCLGALSPPCTTVSWIPAGVALATAEMAAVPASEAASTATAAVAVRRIMVPFAGIRMRPKVAALGVTGCHLILVICVSARAGGSRGG